MSNACDWWWLKENDADYYCCVLLNVSFIQKIYICTHSIFFVSKKIQEIDFEKRIFTHFFWVVCVCVNNACQYTFLRWVLWLFSFVVKASHPFTMRRNITTIIIHLVHGGFTTLKANSKARRAHEKCTHKGLEKAM